MGPKFGQRLTSRRLWPAYRRGIYRINGIRASAGRGDDAWYDTETGGMVLRQEVVKGVSEGTQWKGQIRLPPLDCREIQMSGHCKCCLCLEGENDDRLCVFL